jgi:predicted amidophosphoribosyltransferase
VNIEEVGMIEKNKIKICKGCGKRVEPLNQFIFCYRCLRIIWGERENEYDEQK